MIQPDMPLLFPNDAPIFPYETTIPSAYLRYSSLAMATQLRCTLEEVELDHSPYYEAISYVWGDNHTPAAIISDSEGKELGITRNLEAALIRFRQSKQPVTE
jgi:hypothetical protein